MRSINTPCNSGMNYFQETTISTGVNTYAICDTFIICHLFLPTIMWASIYSPADALLRRVHTASRPAKLVEQLGRAAWCLTTRPGDLSTL